MRVNCELIKNISVGIKRLEKRIKQNERNENCTPNKEPNFIDVGDIFNEFTRPMSVFYLSHLFGIIPCGCYNAVMQQKILALYKKHQELVNYLVVGVIGTVVSIAIFTALMKMTNESVLSNIISWVVTVILMYMLNRYFVFLEHAKDKVAILKEMSTFVSARIATLLLETAIVWLGIDVMKLNSGLKIIAVKTVGQIVVIVLNFVAAKLVIFKKK